MPDALNTPQKLAATETVASPCVRNCCLNAQDVCLGCGRSLDEIKCWQTVDAAAQRAIIRLAQQRHAALGRVSYKSNRG